MPHDIDDLVLMLLRNRGIEARDDIEKFLAPSYDLHLHDPLLMIDMEKAAKRLAAAILSGERIAVWSDYDCDGIPGGVLLHDFLEKCGANFENYIPHRHEEGYGVNIKGIEKLAEQGTKLIVTVDSGITDVEAVARAKELGVDVIVTDHHLPGDMLPDAFAVVNPNARAEETYPFKSLCGAGVAWKLCCAVLAVEPALRAKVPEGWEKWLLDMAGLATIADMVPLNGENRLIAKYGLVVLRKSPRIGLQKLCRVMRTEQRFISEDDVGFMIAPRVNAASRLGDARDAFDLFTTTDEAEAERLAQKLDKSNRERKAQAGAITRAVHERLKTREPIPSVIALGDPEWRPALLGLVANSISEEYARPVFLWGREGNGSLKGSVRSGAVHALDLMKAAENVFEQFGGHAASGGFTAKDDQIFFLEERLVAALATLPPDATEEIFKTDADLEIADVTLKFLRRIEQLAPFGQGNEKPLFRFPNVCAVSIARFGKGSEHLKISLADAPESPGADAILFFARGRVAQTAENIAPGSRVHVIASIERDAFSRKNPVRLRLADLKLV